MLSLVKGRRAIHDPVVAPEVGSIPGTKIEFTGDLTMRSVTITCLMLLGVLRAFRNERSKRAFLLFLRIVLRSRANFV